jgi:hypothetical protein
MMQNLKTLFINKTMRTTYCMKYLLLFATIILNSLAVRSQATDVPPAGFDVIITNNGDIIYGKVVEVGLILIKYKRTDIPDGPIYEIPREEVYAISYRNQLKEYMSPADLSVFGYPNNYNKRKRKAPILTQKATEDSTSWLFNVQNGNIRVGLGSLRNVSRVSDVGEFKDELGVPAIFFSYIFPCKKNIDLGIALGWARFKYSINHYSEYDMLMINRTIKESLMSISALARYNIVVRNFTPYLMGGISYINSNVRSEGEISFTQDGKTVTVQGGGRSGGPGIIMRLGSDIKIKENISCYADFGTGLTLIQIGATIKLEK